MCKKTKKKGTHLHVACTHFLLIISVKTPIYKRGQHRQGRFLRCNLVYSSLHKLDANSFLLLRFALGRLCISLDFVDSYANLSQ